MKQPITGRTVNYEMHLLRSVLKFVGCCTAGDALVAKLDPVPQSKRRPSWASFSHNCPTDSLSPLRFAARGDHGSFFTAISSLDTHSHP
jgi:hypothetical protein